jgi:uncharacterized small protein (DUF1192 family)
MPVAGARLNSAIRRIWAAGPLRVKVVCMIEDEENRKPARLERPVLDVLSVADLRHYIAELQAEIARSEAAIAQKEGARGHANSFFKT